jgi:hypothetical protein
MRGRLGQSRQDFFGENSGEMGQGYWLFRCVNYGFQFGFYTHGEQMRRIKEKAPQFIVSKHPPFRSRLLNPASPKPPRPAGRIAAGKDFIQTTAEFSRPCRDRVCFLRPYPALRAGLLSARAVQH